MVHLPGKPIKPQPPVTATDRLTETMILCIDNNEPLHLRCIELATQTILAHGGEEHIIYEGHDYLIKVDIQEYIEQALSRVKLTRMQTEHPMKVRLWDAIKFTYESMLAAALSEVDWREVAQHYKTKALEQLGVFNKPETSAATEKPDPPHEEER